MYLKQACFIYSDDDGLRSSKTILFLHIFDKILERKLKFLFRMEVLFEKFLILCEI